MAIVEKIEAEIVAMHAAGTKPRRVLVPKEDAAELLEELMRTRRGRIDDQPPIHILGIPYFIEGDTLTIERD